MKDCHTCMYATHTHGTRKMGQNVIVTTSNSITCTREKVGSLTIDDDGMHCSDYAPTIEAEPVKHGRWIETENDSRISGHCSSCGWEAHLYEDDVIGMPYCPNCGARMDKGE